MSSPSAGPSRMNTGEIPRAMVEVARQRTLDGVRQAIMHTLVGCAGATHVQVWLDDDTAAEADFVEHQGHGTIVTLPLQCDGQRFGALVLRLVEPLAGFQRVHLLTFADHAAAVLAHVRAHDQAVKAQRDAQARVAFTLESARVTAGR